MFRYAFKLTEESRSSHPEDGSDLAGRSGSLELAVGIEAGREEGWERVHRLLERYPLLPAIVIHSMYRRAAED